jgi:hypothetical protein
MSCAPDPGAASRPLTEIGSQAVVEGVVARRGDPLPGAYVRLLGASGDFTAEVRTDAAGRFRFYAAPGQWTLRTLTPGADAVDTPVSLSAGEVADVVVTAEAAQAAR